MYDFLAYNHMSWLDAQRMTPLPYGSLLPNEVWDGVLPGASFWSMFRLCRVREDVAAVPVGDCADAWSGVCGAGEVATCRLALDVAARERMDPLETAGGPRGQPPLLAVRRLRFEHTTPAHRTLLHRTLYGLPRRLRHVVAAAAAADAALGRGSDGGDACGDACGDPCVAAADGAPTTTTTTLSVAADVVRVYGVYWRIDVRPSPTAGDHPGGHPGHYEADAEGPTEAYIVTDVRAALLPCVAALPRLSFATATAVVGQVLAVMAAVAGSGACEGDESDETVRDMAAKLLPTPAALLLDPTEGRVVLDCAAATMGVLATIAFDVLAPQMHAAAAVAASARAAIPSVMGPALRSGYGPLLAPEFTPRTSGGTAARAILTAHVGALWAALVGGEMPLPAGSVTVPLPDATLGDDGPSALAYARARFPAVLGVADGTSGTPSGTHMLDGSGVWTAAGLLLRNMTLRIPRQRASITDAAAHPLWARSDMQMTPARAAAAISAAHASAHAAAHIRRATIGGQVCAP